MISLKIEHLVNHSVCILEIIGYGLVFPSDKKINTPQYMSITVKKYTVYCAGLQNEILIIIKKYGKDRLNT